MPAMMLRRAVLLALLAALLLGIAGGAAFHEGRAADYDDLALALSWSPTYCASQAGRDDGSQCAPGRRHGFTVHGLWPQYEQGWPEYCASEEGFVADAVIAQMRDVMPSKSLVIHEWKRHGTCSGLTPRGYFAATRALFAKLRIPARYIAPETAIVIGPAELAADFLSTNPWLSPGMISVRCASESDAARLGEVIFCFTRAFEPRRCGGNRHRRCAAPQLTLPPVR